MYSQTTGTGMCSALKGIHRRTPSRVPSLSTIQLFSIVRKGSFLGMRHGPLPGSSPSATAHPLSAMAHPLSRKPRRVIGMIIPRIFRGSSELGACLTNGRRHEGDPHRADFCDRFASIVGTMGVKGSQKDADVGRPQ